MKVLAMGLGAATKTAWPATKYVIISAILALGVALLLVWWRRPEDRLRVFRIALFFGSLAGLALGIGWARTALGPAAVFASRYATLAAPFWCATYLGWELVRRSGIRRFAQTALFFAAAAFAVANREEGEGEAVYWRDLRAPIVSEIRSGATLREIVARHHKQMYYAGADALTRDMQLLHARGIGISLI